MNESLERARSAIQDWLEKRQLAHLSVAADDLRLVLYSTEDDVPALRASFTPLQGGRYALDLANHRGNWQPTPYAGTVGELLRLLEEKLAFALARWH